MKETELIKLFTVIQNAYSGFTFDRFKVELWLDLLNAVPFSLAQSNLRRYILTADNKFPPHPGILAEKPGREGQYIPNAVETRTMLQENEKQLLRGERQIPESARERMRQLGYKSSDGLG